MDHRLTPQQKNEIIENAFRSRPLADMPRDLSLDVMSRIGQTSAPRFQLAWQDFALALVLSLCVGAVLFAAQNLPPIWITRLRIQGILFYQGLIVNARWLIPAALFSLAAFFSALAIPSLFTLSGLLSSTNKK